MLTQKSEVQSDQPAPWRKTPSHSLGVVPLQKSYDQYGLLTCGKGVQEAGKF